MKKLLLFIALLSSNLSFANDIFCKVVGITDGDTIKCLTSDKKQIKVRLYQIDAPESKQAFGSKSKQALSNLVFNKDILLELHGKDKYRRTLGTIYFSQQVECRDHPSFGYCVNPKGYDINLEMINQGMAWYYPFAKKNKQYKQAEEQAKKKKVGLWADKTPVAPWEFRRK